MIMVQLKYVNNLVCVVLGLDMFSLSNNPTDILLHRNLFFCPKQKGLLDARASKKVRDLLSSKGTFSNTVCMFVIKIELSK